MDVIVEIDRGEPYDLLRRFFDGRAIDREVGIAGVAGMRRPRKDASAAFEHESRFRLAENAAHEAMVVKMRGSRSAILR